MKFEAFDAETAVLLRRGLVLWMLMGKRTIGASKAGVEEKKFSVCVCVTMRWRRWRGEEGQRVLLDAESSRRAGPAVPNSGLS